jgi:hypothetical protein
LIDFEGFHVENKIFLNIQKKSFKKNSSTKKSSLEEAFFENFNISTNNII